MTTLGVTMTADVLCSDCCFIFMSVILQRYLLNYKKQENFKKY